MASGQIKRVDSKSAPITLASIATTHMAALTLYNYRKYNICYNAEYESVIYTDLNGITIHEYNEHWLWYIAHNDSSLGWLDNGRGANTKGRF